MEVLGGNGYVETSVMPRLLREAPVNSIWEGAGNIMCLDVLRALAREPEAAALLLHDLQQQAAGDAPLHAAVHALAQGLQRALRQAPDAMEAQARHWVQQLVLVHRPACCAAMPRRRWPMPLSPRAAVLAPAAGCWVPARSRGWTARPSCSARCRTEKNAAAGARAV